MKKLIFALLLVFAILLTAGCVPNTPEPKTIPKETNPKPPIKNQEEIPLGEVLNKTQKVMKTIKGYQLSTTYTWSTGIVYSSATGSEQINPQIAHYTLKKNGKTREYYRNKQTEYEKDAGKWTHQHNYTGQVLFSEPFTSNIDIIIKDLGTSKKIPGVSITKTSNQYIVSIDFLVYKPSTTSDEDFAKMKKDNKVYKTELTIDANTFEPKKYTHINGIDYQDTYVVNLTPINTPVSIPTEVIQSAKPKYQ